MTKVVLVLVATLAFFLTGCLKKAVYIQGGDKGRGQIEVDMTGGRITLEGPFTYCSEPWRNGTPKGSMCKDILGEEDGQRGSDSPAN